VETRTETKPLLEKLSYLPFFAQYILQHRLNEFVGLQMQILEESDLPTMKYFGDISYEQKFEITRKSAVEMLTDLSQQRAKQHVEELLRKWENNVLPELGKDDIVAEDITLINYLRKTSLIHFITDYSTEPGQIIELIKEIDLFLLYSETIHTTAYINLLKQRASSAASREQSISAELKQNEYLYKRAEALTHLGSYQWDLKTNALTWSHELYRIYGLDPAKDKIDFDYISSFNFPEDTPRLRSEYSAAIKEKRPFDFNYRITSKDKTNKILHARGELILNEQAEPVTVIGTVQDVTERQTLIQKLRRDEALYKQAEELVNMGNWSWDVKNNKLEWTDHLYRVYGLEPQSEEITIDRFLSFVHPDDREYVAKGVNEIHTKDLLDYTFRIITAKGEMKILRSIAQVHRDEKGNAIYIVGTERDTTEKQTLINQLRRSESLYKQAQALAHLGNWSWDIKNNKIEWSDELYRIYGMEPQSQNLTYEEYLSFIHPDDKERIAKQVQSAIEKNEPWDYTHKIIRKNGEVRIVYATGEVITNEKGEPYMMIGTAQDITEKQTLIERLQESEKLFKQAQSLAHLGNWTWEIKTNVFQWSDEMFKIFEIGKENKITYEDWLNYVHPSDRQDVLNYIKKCVEEKKLYDRIHRIVLPSGKIKTVHRKGELICDDHGQPVKMIGTTQDITEEYRVQQELRENQTFIRKITDATPSIIASYNINTGKYVFISEGLEKLLGYNTEDVLEKGVEFFVGILHPDDTGTVMQKNTSALEEANEHPDRNDMVVEFTYRMRHINGQYRWFHTYGTIFDRNSEGKVEHVLNISLDVTDQVEATEKIKEQEHFIQQIADASPTILYLYDANKQSMVYINREIFFVLGYLPDEVLAWGSDITEKLYHPDDYHLLPARKQSGKNFQQVDSMIQYECRMKNNEGEWRWLLVREIVFKTDEDGNIIQILGAALDINRRKEMEKTILQNTLLLEQSNASLEEFAYVASHDLKEPLRKISTFGDRLVATQSNNLTADGKIYLQKIVDASQRMQTMISDLLSISMISNNTSFEQYSLQKILDETLQTLEFKIEQQNAVIKSDRLPEAKIIPSQFRQLFQNLLSNSLKFMRPGVQPVITITYSTVSSSEIIHYQLAPASQYHKLEFNDNGIGFENEFAGKIFAIFQRLHGRSEYEGSGIGLAICKKIVEHHGGIIYANGVTDVGSTFTILLPA
jgi:PAS domain S-box-containing protein